MKIKYLILILLLSITTSYAKQDLKKFKNSELNITADDVVLIRNEGKIFFNKNVKSTHGDFTLTADNMIVDLKELDDGKFDLTQIKADSNVIFQNKEVKATGNTGIYNILNNIITLEDNVKVKEKGITLFAEKFIYNTITKTTNIISNKKEEGRVLIILDDK